MAKQNSRQLREQRKENMKRASYIGVALALLIIGLTGVIIWAVNAVAGSEVIAVGNTKIDKDMYTCVYYYNTMTAQQWNQYGFELTKDPYEQEFDYQMDNKKYDNWGDFFESQTNETLRFLYAMQALAEKGGYVYSDEVEANVRSELSAAEKEKGTAKSFSTYMLENYGAPIEKSTLEQYLELYYRSTEFYKAITESKAMFEQYLGDSFSSLEAVYLENSDAVDVVSFRYYSLKNNKTYAEKIEALKNAKSEKEFQALCNAYENNEEYTKNDSSLYSDISLARINSLSKGDIAKKISSKSARAGDVYFADSEENGKPITEVVYVVKARAKNENAYKKSEVKMWEFGAMGIVLDEYAEKNQAITVSDRGMDYFKRIMVIPS